MATTTAAELASKLSGDVEGNGQTVVLGAQAVEKAGPHDITFVADEKNLRRLFCCRAGVVIVPRKLAAQIPTSARPSALILVDDALNAFLQAVVALRPQRRKQNCGISDKALVSASARFGSNPNIHPGAVIGDDVVLGDNCEVHPGACIGAGCRLGDDVTIHPNAVLYPEMLIGNRVIIHANSVVGADGFGYRFVKGRHVKLPHFGTVRIEDDVEIGACSTVDRAMIGETVIGEGSKLDNLVMIGHNCEIGKHNVFASQVCIAGSVVTGDYVLCSGQVGIVDHVRVGDNVRVGGKAGVHKDLPGGQTYIGSPAAPEAEARRIVMAQQRLPELRKQLRDLEKQMEELTARLTALEPRPELRAAS